MISHLKEVNFNITRIYAQSSYYRLMKAKEIIGIILFSILCFGGVANIHSQGDDHKIADNQPISQSNKIFLLDE